MLLHSDALLPATGLCAGIDDAMAMQETLEPSERFQRLRMLRERWLDEGSRIRSNQGRMVRRCLLELALECDDWPMVALFVSEMRELGETGADDEADLAMALWKQGDVDQALEVARSALFKYPYCQRAEALHAHLHTTPAAGADAEWLDEDMLRLRPLEHHHLRDFRWQYDESLVDLCCLPAFESDASWHEWLDDCLSPGNQALFGIWHDIWGFIGCVSLTLADDVGLFYYWIGSDYRGQGYGPLAGQLLLGCATARWGLQACYATVFAHNECSHRALEKMGFAATGIPVAPEARAPEMLLRWPTAGSGSEEEVRALFSAIGSETRVAASDRFLSAVHQSIKQSI